ncbi:MAG: hypothetical protein C0475_05545 [Planctomyces sp.]|nr:hypothetical protein [Planctomyces sp.]MBA4038789.1 hypothetical protein [Planctomyces sp.]MBA4119293.1 hypothetical protein [Isosphaera sp.]
MHQSSDTDARSAGQDQPVAPPAVGPARLTIGQRLACAVAAGALLAGLAVAASLVPDPDGHGTHEQLGLPACGMVVATGLPCPTCGVTTACATAAGGDLIGAAAIQPVGAIGSLVTAVLVWGLAWSAATGSRVLSALTGVLSPRLMWAGLGVLAGSWVYKLLTWNATNG